MGNFAPIGTANETALWQNGRRDQMDFRDLAGHGRAREKAHCNLVHLINEEGTFPISVPILTGRLGSYMARLKGFIQVS